jgi:hypothetical protein
MIMRLSQKLILQVIIGVFGAIHDMRRDLETWPRDGDGDQNGVDFDVATEVCVVGRRASRALGC